MRTGMTTGTAKVSTTASAGKGKTDGAVMALHTGELCMLAMAYSKASVVR